MAESRGERAIAELGCTELESHTQIAGDIVSPLIAGHQSGEAPL